MWILKMTVIPIIIGALGTIKKNEYKNITINPW